MSTESKTCAATRRGGTTHCAGYAVEGSNYCRLHGGASAKHRDAALARIRAELEESVRKLGMDPETTLPADALMMAALTDAIRFIDIRRMAIRLGLDTSHIDAIIRYALDHHGPDDGPQPSTA